MSKSPIEHCGYTWYDNGDWYVSTINDRITATNWKFGDAYQCKLYIKYGGEDVGIGIAMQKTRKDAMAAAVSWAKSYIEGEPPSVEETFSTCYKQYHDLFKTRIYVIEHLFFVIGNGYDWLDGAIVSNGPEDYLDSKALFETKSQTRPLPDDGLPRRFYPVSKDFSDICRVPNDVRPDWLALAYEAATILRDRSTSEGNNATIGNELVKQLERRFPQ